MTLPIKDRARARHSTPARDCACGRTCDRPSRFRRHLSDAKIILPKRHPSSNPQHHRAPISRSVTPSSAVGKDIHASAVSDSVAQRTAGLECRRRRGRDDDALARAGIAAPAGRARSGREGAEAGDPDGLATGKRVGDGREHDAHGGIGFRLGQRSLGGDAAGEVGLVHSGSPAKVPSFERITLPEIGVEGIAPGPAPAHRIGAVSTRVHAPEVHEGVRSIADIAHGTGQQRNPCPVRTGM